MTDRIVCRCEEVLESEIRDAIRSGARTLEDVKRLTRAGMGLCQGSTCQRIIASILAEELPCAPSDVCSPSIRPPVRPVCVETMVGKDWSSS